MKKGDIVRITGKDLVHHNLPIGSTGNITDVDNDGTVRVNYRQWVDIRECVVVNFHSYLTQIELCE